MFTKRLWSVCRPLLWAVSEWVPVPGSDAMQI